MAEIQNAIRKLMNEGKMDSRHIEFDTLGGDVRIYIDYRDYPNKGQRIGLNTASRGFVDFVNKNSIEFTDTRELNTREKELRTQVTAFMKEIVDEFDAKVIAKMKELGFELEG